MQLCEERFFVITRDLYAYPLPVSMKPQHWVSPTAPQVHGFPMSSKQVRTDDFQRSAGEYRLEGIITARSEQALIESAERWGQIVRQALYLQRSGWGLLALLDGSEIDLKPEGSKSSTGLLGVTLVAKDRKWLKPDGSVMLGER